jgi:hypothetical protein
MDLTVSQLLAWHLATAEDKRPNDLYAGAVTVLVVIIFAKFVTHNHSLEHTANHKSGLLGLVVGQGGHTVCIWAAWIAMSLSFATLGGWLSIEQLVRVVVGVLVVIAAAILSVDTGLARSGSPTGERRGSGSRHPGGRI